MLGRSRTDMNLGSPEVAVLPVEEALIAQSAIHRQTHTHPERGCCCTREDLQIQDTPPMTKERLKSQARLGDAVKLKVTHSNSCRFDPQHSNTIIVVGLVYKSNSEKNDFHFSVTISFSTWQIPA